MAGKWHTRARYSAGRDWAKHDRARHDTNQFIRETNSLSESNIVTSVTFRTMSTLASEVVSRRERVSEFSYPSLAMRDTSTHWVELAVSCREGGKGGRKSSSSVDMKVGDGERVCVVCVCVIESVVIGLCVKEGGK